MHFRITEFKPMLRQSWKENMRSTGAGGLL